MSQFKLIEGTFTVAEAKDIILALFEYKINFHSKQNFSSEIRKGQKDARSLKRRDELLLSRDAFLQKISAMNAEDTIGITADIIML